MTRKFALVVGIAFLVAGVLGFIPGITVNHEYLLGIFAVDPVHNLIHLLVGAFGVAAYYYDRSRLYCQILGVVYLLVGILGFVPPMLVGGEMLFGLFHVNLADNLLHLLVGAAAAYLGFAPQFSGRRITPTHWTPWSVLEPGSQGPGFFTFTSAKKYEKDGLVLKVETDEAERRRAEDRTGRHEDHGCSE